MEWTLYAGLYLVAITIQLVTLSAGWLGVWTTSHFNSPQSVLVCFPYMPPQLILGDEGLGAEWTGAVMSEQSWEVIFLDVVLDPVLRAFLLGYTTQSTCVLGGNFSSSILLDCKLQQITPGVPTSTDNPTEEETRTETDRLMIKEETPAVEDLEVS